MGRPDPRVGDGPGDGALVRPALGPAPRGDVMPLVAFGILLLVLTAVQLPFGPTPAEVALLGGAGAACLLCGVVALGAQRRGRPDPARMRVTPLAGGPFVLAAGLAALLVGAEAGLWLVLIGAGLVVIGAALLARERRAA